MSTFTNSSFTTYQAENYVQAGGYVDQSVQQWLIDNTDAGFVGSGYVVASGANQGGVNQATIFMPVTAPNAPQNVWIRCKGIGQFSVVLANDPTTDTLNAPIVWDWVLLPTSIVNQSQIQFITVDPNVQIDSFIITDATETPTDELGFTNTPDNGGGTGGTGANNNSGICAGTETVACFHCYEAESAFWLEPGNGGANWSIDNTLGNGASGDSFITAGVSTAANDLDAAGKAHIAITPTTTTGWSTWFRVRGQGTFVHSWADDAGITPIIVSATTWEWVKSSAPDNPNAAKIRLSTQDAGVSVDKIAMIDSDEIPTDTDGFCLTNGSGGSNSGEGEQVVVNVEQNDDRYLYLPENLTCIVTIIPPEITNR